MTMPIQALPQQVRDKIHWKSYWLRQRYLVPYCFIHINKCGGTSIERALGLKTKHDTALERIDFIGKRHWERKFTFTVIRHPYAKVVSHYKYRVKTNRTGLGDNPIPLNDWVARSYGDRDPQYYTRPLMFQPCLHWITDETGKILVDEIYRLETLNEDWPGLCARLGVPATPLGSHNQAGASSEDTARAALSEASQALIQELFAKDFETFNYTP